METNNPLEKTHDAAAPPPVSKRTFPIAGILVDVYGLEELSPQNNDVACLWLLHPRLGTKERMDPVASQSIYEWSKRTNAEGGRPHNKGLIAVSFDQRNHGTRQVDKLSNLAWREGNDRHAQDMFSCYHGTAQDTSLLINYIPAYAFPRNEHRISSHHVLGISLGGHAAWHCIIHEPRITSAIVVIGCPDYTRLMLQRAEKSKRETWTKSSPPGTSFLGSTDFPPALHESVERWDPAGFLQEGNRSTELVGDVQQHFTQKIRQHLAGKKILNLSGGADKLVPYACGQPFLKCFKEIVEDQKDISFEDLIFDGVGHEYTPKMAEKAVSWLCDVLENEGQAPHPKESKI